MSWRVNILFKDLKFKSFLYTTDSGKYFLKFKQEFTLLSIIIALLPNNLAI